MVLANSSVVHASHTKNPDLFWALRGGGNNFGVVTSVTLDIFNQSQPYYTFQRWSMDMLESVLDRLAALTLQIPPEIEMVATTLGWHVQMNQLTITERLVVSEMPKLPRILPVPSSMQLKEVVVSNVLDERIYVDTTLAMSQKMDRMNAAGSFNYFGSVTVKSNVRVFMAIADVFRDEIYSIKDARSLQVNIVYNPLTVSTIEKMSRRGGKCPGYSPRRWASH